MLLYTDYNGYLYQGPGLIILYLADFPVQARDATPHFAAGAAQYSSKAAALPHSSMLGEIDPWTMASAGVGSIFRLGQRAAGVV